MESGAFTVKDVRTRLLPVIGSGFVAPTPESALMKPTTLAFATIVTVAVPPLPIEPKVHPVPEQLPTVVVAETSERPTGSAVLVKTLSASAPPACLASRLMVTLLPRATASLLALPVSVRSADSLPRGGAGVDAGGAASVVKVASQPSRLVV